MGSGCVMDIAEIYVRRNLPLALRLTSVQHAIIYADTYMFCHPNYTVVLRKAGELQSYAKLCIALGL